MKIKSLAVTAAILGVAIALTGCGQPSSQSVPGGNTKPAATEESTAPEPAPEPAAEEGSLETPYPVGYAASVFQGDEDNTLATISAAILDPNAGAAIAQANQFNDAAQPGYHYVAVEYTFTGRNKTEPANVSLLLYDWSLATDDGTLIAESNTSVVLPDGWNQTYDVNDLYDGQTGAAVVVYQVPDTAGALFATAYGKYVTL